MLGCPIHREATEPRNTNKEQKSRTKDKFQKKYYHTISNGPKRLKTRTTLEYFTIADEETLF
jgi:hypothetical protein